MGSISFSPAARMAVYRLEQAGFQAYAVGGCVRDSLLGKRPLDWDLATSARPEQVKACFSGCRVVETGIRHGTVTVLADGMPLEITTFRSEGDYKDHRHPDAVSFGERLEDDLSRRDFTINAMACRPGEPVIDRFGGQRDLKARQIRCVGEPARRFEEDALRIMRALRFAAVLGFSLEEETGRALQKQAPFLRWVAAERLAKELDGLLAGQFAAPVLLEYGPVLACFLPELESALQREEWSRAVECAARTNGDNIQKLAALFAWMGEPCCRGMLQRLRYDGKTVRTVSLLAKEWETPLPRGKTELLRLLNRMGEENTRRLVKLWLARSPREQKAEGIQRELERLLQGGACYSLPQLEISGKELVGLGLRPGPEMGRLLQALLEQVLDGTLPNHKEALLQAAAKLAGLP